MCIYEPRTKEAYAACTSPHPEYDLEVSSKVISSRLPNSKSDQYANFQIIVALKSPLDYLAIKCDLPSLSWVLVSLKNGEESLEAVFPDGEIKANVFYSLLIQIRGCSISVDIDGVPVFTAVRLSTGESLSGLVGLVAKVCFHSGLLFFF